MDNKIIGSDFINRISSAALESRAVDHPYLDAMQKGALPNMHLALQDFAYQYGWYSSDFVKYLSVVIGNLEDASHREILLENLAEENGHPHDVELPPEVIESIDGQPHTLLFQRFQEAIGVDADYQRNAKPCAAASHWSQQFSNLCEMNQYVGIGAIGIGTEFIVSRIYKKILKCIKRHSDLSIIDHVFFDLHSECDDEHAEQLMGITQALALDKAACEEIEYGVNEALHLRTMFWDSMLERALGMSASKPLAAGRFSVV